MKTLLLLALLVLVACDKQPTIVPITPTPPVSKNTLIFLDEFNRADTPMGSLGIAPDGLPYDITGIGQPSAQVYNQQYVSTSKAGPTYASKYFAGKNISRVTITFKFTQDPANTSGLALITSSDSASIKLNNMNHWVFTGNGQVGATIWHNGEQNLLPAYSSVPTTQSYVIGKLYTISLTMDDKWVHCLLPDGSTVDIYDERLKLVAGRRFISEIGAGIAVTKHEVYGVE